MSKARIKSEQLFHNTIHENWFERRRRREKKSQIHITNQLEHEKKNKNIIILDDKRE